METVLLYFIIIPPFVSSTNILLTTLTFFLCVQCLWYFCLLSLFFYTFLNLFDNFLSWDRLKCFIKMIKSLSNVSFFLGSIIDKLFLFKLSNSFLFIFHGLKFFFWKSLSKTVVPNLIFSAGGRYDLGRRLKKNLLSKYIICLPWDCWNFVHRLKFEKRKRKYVINVTTVPV